MEGLGLVSPYRHHGPSSEYVVGWEFVAAVRLLTNSLLDHTPSQKLIMCACVDQPHVVSSIMDVPDLYIPSGK